MAEQKYLSEEEERAFFERLKKARIAVRKKKNFIFYGIGNEADIAEYDKDIEDGNKALEEVHALYGKLIFSIVSKYAANAEMYEELSQEAEAVLYDALESFSPDRARFTTYLSSLINSRLSTVVESDGLFTEKFSGRKLRYKIEEAIKTLKEKGNAKPSDEEIAKECGMKAKKVRQILNLQSQYMTSNNFISLNQTIDRENPEEGDQTLMEMIASDEDPESTVLNNLMSETIDKAFRENLTPEEEMILRDRFGMNEEQAVISREDIAKKYGITVTDVRMRERMAMRKLAKVKALKGMV